MLIIDFESTGLASSFYSIPCEVGIIYTQKEKIIDCYSSLIKFPQGIESYFYEGLNKSGKFHKIDLTMLNSEGKDIKVVAKEVYDFISKYLSIERSIYAWNFASDKIFLLKLFMFGELQGGIDFVSSLNWKELMPKYMTSLDKFLKKELYDYINFLLAMSPKVKTYWKNQHRHRALYDTILEFAVMRRYLAKELDYS